jgi:hypothetical protein
MSDFGGGVVTPDMEPAEVEGLELMLNRSRQLPFPVFDSDNHFYETPEALTKFIPEKYAGIIKYVDINGRKKLAIDDKISDFIPNPTFSRVAPPGGQASDPHQRRSVASPDAFFHPEARVKLLGELGIGKTLMFPTLAGTVEEQLRHDLYAFHAVAHAFNRWVDEHWSFNYQNTIFAVPIVPLSILDEALKELDYVLSRGAKAIWLRAGPVPGLFGPRSFALPEFDPFWKKVEEADILVAIHSGDVGYQEYVNIWEGTSGQEHRPFAKAPSPAFRKLMTNYTGASATDTCAAIVGHGLALRFPKLRFAFIEFHPQWVKDFLPRAVKAYATDPGAFEENPIETFRRSIFVHWFQDRDFQDFLDLVGVDNLMFGSDFPHVEGMNDPLAYADFLKDMSLEDQAKIMGGNLARILKVDI